MKIPARVALLSVVLLIAAAVAVQAGEFTETFELNAEELDLVDLIGEVRLEPASGDDFEIRVEVRGDDASRDIVEIDIDKGRRAGVAVRFPDEKKFVYPPLGRGKTTFNFRDETDDKSSWLGRIFNGLGDRITVSGRGRGVEVWADVTVRVPEGGEIAVRLGVGRIEAENVKGDLSLDINSGSVAAQNIEGSVLGDTGSGSITFRDIEGDVDADTGSGGVVIKRCRGDRVHADTGSGSVDVDDVDCRKLHVDTGSGGVTAVGVRTDSALIDTGSGGVKLHLDRMGPGKYIIDTGSGGIDLVMPRDPSADVSCDTGSGAITVNIDGVDVDTRDKDDVRFTVGGGDARVVLDTGSGGIKIRTH